MKAAVLLAVLALLGAGCNDEPTKAEKAALNAVSSSTQGRGLAELFDAALGRLDTRLGLGGPRLGATPQPGHLAAHETGQGVAVRRLVT